MATNDFKAFAIGASANVLTQPDFVALTSLITNGFQAGTANSEQLNKVWRQASVIAALIGDYIGRNTGADALDDGDLGTLLGNLEKAIHSYNISTSVSGTANAIEGVFPFTPSTSDIVNGQTFLFRATLANTSTVPTFTPNAAAVSPKTIVKPGNLPLGLGDISSSDWSEVIYDSSLDKWVLMNPYWGNSIGTGSSSTTDYVTIPFLDKITNTKKTLVLQWGSTVTSGGAGGFTQSLPLTMTTAVYYAATAQSDNQAATITGISSTAITGSAVDALVGANSPNGTPIKWTVWGFV